MIPKVIHYCWFGGNPLPELAVKCIASWKKYLPEYEIIEWNESNFNLDEYIFAKQALENRKCLIITQGSHQPISKNTLKNVIGESHTPYKF